jgi:hypothetical protein
MQDWNGMLEKEREVISTEASIISDETAAGVTLV